MIGKEIDAVSNPHGPRRISVGQTQPFELTSFVRVDPYFARGTAAIALPSRRIALVTSDSHVPVRTETERTHMSEFKLARDTAVCIDGKRSQFAFVPR